MPDAVLATISAQVPLGKDHIGIPHTAPVRVTIAYVDDLAVILFIAQNVKPLTVATATAALMEIGETGDHLAAPKSQMIGKAGQILQAMLFQDEIDVEIQPIAEDDHRYIVAAAEMEKPFEMGIDLLREGKTGHLIAGGPGQGAFGQHTIAGADLSLFPALHHIFPSTAGELGEHTVAHVQAADGAVEVTEDNPGGLSWSIAVIFFRSRLDHLFKRG